MSSFACGVSREPFDAIVVGNGFAGLMGALSLTRQAALRGVSLRVALVGPEGNQFFTPGLYEAIESDDPALACIPFSARLPRSITFIEGKGRVHALPSASSGCWEVKVESHVSSPRTLRSPHVLLATGALRGRTESLSPLASWHDWQRLREGLRAAGRVSVVGGGVSGVELAASLACALPSARITLRERRDSLLTGAPSALKHVCRLALERMGIECVLGQSGDVPEADVSLDARGPWNDISRLENLLGPAFAPLLAKGAFDPETFCLRVTPTLQVPLEEGLWALGDLAQFPDAAPSAQAAVQLAHQWAASVLRVRAGAQPFPARVLDLGIVVRLGPRQAAGVVRIPGRGAHVLTGVAAQAAKAAVRVKYLAELALAGRGFF